MRHDGRNGQDGWVEQVSILAILDGEDGAILYIAPVPSIQPFILTK